MPSALRQMASAEDASRWVIVKGGVVIIGQLIRVPVAGSPDHT
ncbi:Uncharacterized protein AC502_3346 [Pseudomonas syringae pv. maculicola]|nr:Uncharacterized protein AC502_3346 [Pseudomonas syringae pv. maculicola]KPC05007.1 Uncharacterized protein AC506_4218 [Pseudomonas syringae pv. maculicola str. M6]KPC08094.1 Uncharacterized protein AC500_0665 [Pseudomonas amygdali pv. lachrymans]KPC12610.1 Uncharacterized protein AC503_5406 [Pseudomonas syringae pv. maculicola]KPX69249.1 hypothetical protein ALO84_05428 [Pseudomonas syringae pv. maculicola]